MVLHINGIPTVQRSAFVAPTHNGSVAAPCPQVRFRGANDAAKAAKAANTAMATGRRPWSPLIT